MQTGKIARTVLLAAVLVGFGVHASPGVRVGDNSSPSNIAVRDALRASHVIGMAVRDPSGRRVGDVADLIVDMSRDRLRDVVVSVGGVLGIGDRIFVYPPRMLKRHSDNAIVIDVDASALRDARHFDANRWPDWNGSYYETVDQFFNHERTAFGRSLWRASALMGMRVDDELGNRIGHVTDLIVDLERARVQAVIEVDRIETIPDRRVAVPLRALEIGADGEAITSRLNRQALAVLPSARNGR